MCLDENVFLPENPTRKKKEKKGMKEKGKNKSTTTQYKDFIYIKSLVTKFI